jgi:putative two-component system response regulator
LIDGDDVSLSLTEKALKNDYFVLAIRSAARMFMLLDINNDMPDMIIMNTTTIEIDGVEALRRLRSIRQCAAIPVLILTNRADSVAATEFFSLGAVDYITRPVLPVVLLQRVKNCLETHSRILFQTKRMQRLQNGIVSVLAEMINRRDTEISDHVTRTSEYLKILITELANSGLYANEMKDWKLETVLPSARLHDVGKIVIPDYILNKPGRLTADEFDIIKTHTTEGELIIEEIVLNAGGGAFLSHAKVFAGFHHERWDGMGYPRGLKENNIPLEGRILAVADVYDALISERPYKRAFTCDEAEKIILDGSGTQFDPHIVAVFFNVRRLFRSVVVADDSPRWTAIEHNDAVYRRYAS